MNTLGTLHVSAKQMSNYLARKGNPHECACHQSVRTIIIKGRCITRSIRGSSVRKVDGDMALYVRGAVVLDDNRVGQPVKPHGGTLFGPGIRLEVYPLKGRVIGVALVIICPEVAMHVPVHDFRVTFIDTLTASLTLIDALWRGVASRGKKERRRGNEGV